ncbi:hypothetical protein Q5P01_000924 [Channa striata]|uniref:Uncharacterized protein n=1 Tax=Channa striata TaxID=64152 RepID=A0AA88IHR8_CHASR|nr:hypothetical protein Q5P01_000924 [Channa striata]
MLVADALISSYNKRRAREIGRLDAPLPRCLSGERSLRSHRKVARLRLGNRAPRRFARSASPTDLGSYEEMVLSTLASVERMRPARERLHTTIMDISRNPPHRPATRATSEPPRHGHAFQDLLVSGLRGTCRDAEGARYLASAARALATESERVDTYHQIATASSHGTADPGAGPGTSSERRVQAQVGPGHGDRATPLSSAVVGEEPVYHSGPNGAAAAALHARGRRCCCP